MYGETDGVIYIFLPCANISILTVTKFTEMNRVAGRSMCTLLRDAALGRNLPKYLKKAGHYHLESDENISPESTNQVLIFRTSADHSCVLSQLFSCHLSPKWSNAPAQQRQGHNAGGEWSQWHLGEFRAFVIPAGVLGEDHADSGRYLRLKFVGGVHFFF